MKQYYILFSLINLTLPPLISPLLEAESFNKNTENWETTRTQWLFKCRPMRKHIPLAKPSRKTAISIHFPIKISLLQSPAIPLVPRLLNRYLHCKEKIPKIRTRYSQKRNSAVTFPISTFMCLWAIYIFPRSICLFCCRKYEDRCWEYINRSHTHEYENWDWGRAIPRKGIHKWVFRCSVV